MAKVFKEAENGKILEIGGGLEPMYLASSDTTNPDVLALAEIIFWLEDLKEHADYAEKLLPETIEGLKNYREKMLAYMRRFEALEKRAKGVNIALAEISGIVSETAKEAESMSGDLREMQARQASGAIHTLLWISLIDHIAREGEYFVERSQALINGEVPFSRDDIVVFWSGIMSDHGAFMANYLDPNEVDLADKTISLSNRFFDLQDEHDLQGSVDPVIMTLDEFIEFKDNILEGVLNGEIDSMLLPAFVSHLRREAIFFRDQLSKADMDMGARS